MKSEICYSSVSKYFTLKCGIAERVSLKPIILNYSLQSSNELFLNFPLRNDSYCTLGDRSFNMAAPHIWNSLPIFIRKATTVNSFKSQVETYYFKLAYFKFTGIDKFYWYFN